MRSVLIVAFLVALPLVQAQAPSFELADPAGDVQVVSAAGQMPEPVPVSSADVLRVAIQETPADLRWTFAFPAMDDAFRRMSPILFTDFKVGDEPHQLYMALGVGERDLGRWVAKLVKADAVVAELPIRVHKDTSEMVVFMDRSLLADGGPARGQAVHDVQVRSLQMGDDQTGFIDFVPDGTPAAGFILSHGPTQAGTVRLTSPRPFPASNGEAGLVLYEVVAQNFGPESAFHLEAVDLPNGWSLGAPEGFASPARP